MRQNPDGAVRYGTFALVGRQLVQCPEAPEVTPAAPFSCWWTDIEDGDVETSPSGTLCHQKESGTARASHACCVHLPRCLTVMARVDQGEMLLL